MTFQSQDIGTLANLLRELQRPQTCLSPLLAHAETVRAQGDRLGLVSAGDLDHILSRHTADSLLFALARAPEPNERWADVGSGAGFPGLPLAIVYPETSFLLIEPQQRRAGFLELQVSELGLTNVEVTTQRAEAIEGQFDVATARALAEPLFALEATWRLVQPDGTAIVAVGPAVHVPPSVVVEDVIRPGVDSSGRLLIMARPRQGA